MKYALGGRWSAHVDCGGDRADRDALGSKHGSVLSGNHDDAITNNVSSDAEPFVLAVPADDWYSWVYVLHLLYPCCHSRRPPITW
jgi:hypothetical protein